jgi:GntR family transcriptional regulator
MWRIDNLSQTPVYEQLIEQVKRFILIGALHSGDALPSVRGLSVTLSVNPNTIQKAYSELTLRGILVAVPGKGLFVSENALEVLLSEAQKKVTELEGLVSLLKLSGIGKDEILKSINKIYEGEGNK